MAIEPIDGVREGMQPRQLDSEPSPPDGDTGDFVSTLDGAAAVEPSQTGPAAAAASAVEASPTIPAPASVESVQPVAATEPVNAVDASPAAEILERIGEGHARLDALIAEMRSGQQFTVQELLGLQTEVFKLTLELEATTTLVSEGLSGFNKLMQTQV